MTRTLLALAQLIALSLGLCLAPAAMAQSLVGRVVTTAGVGIPNVLLVFSNGGPGTFRTDANGNYNVTGLTNRTYNTIDFQGPLGAFTSVQVAGVRVAGATTLPNVVLQPGLLVTGSLVGPAGPVVGGNMNVYDLHGNKFLTPNDATGVGGAFAITAPFGPVVVRAVPPVGSGLIPIDRTLDMTAPVNLGTLTTVAGVVLSGTVVDAVSGVPMPGVNVRTFNTITGAEIAQLAPNTNAFGAFSLLVPPAFYELQFDAPAFNPHVPKQVFGVAVPSARTIGQVRMERAVSVVGGVAGPAGPVANADIDVYTPTGEKLWTPGDKTNAAGTFTMLLAPGNYTFTAQPPVVSGLTGAKTGLLPVTLGGPIGTIQVQPGIALQLQVSGPSGPDAGANLNLVDPATGESAVLVGDHADAAGRIVCLAPPGVCTLQIRSSQGSLGAPISIPNCPIFFPASASITLPTKLACVDLRGFGIQSTANNGSIPFVPTLGNPQAIAQPMLIDVFVKLSTGVESPILSGVPLTMPAGVTLPGSVSFLPIGTLPASELGKVLRYTIRVRSPSDNSVLDEAFAEFAAY